MATAQKVDHIGDQVQDMKSSVDVKLDDLKAMLTQVDRNPVIASSADKPVPPSVFIGRDAVVNKIDDHLVSPEPIDYMYMYNRQF